MHIQISQAYICQHNQTKARFIYTYKKERQLQEQEKRFCQK